MPRHCLLLTHLHAHRQTDRQTHQNWDTSQIEEQRHFHRSPLTVGNGVFAFLAVSANKSGRPCGVRDFLSSCGCSPRQSVVFWIQQRLAAFTWTGINVPLLCWRTGYDLPLASVFQLLHFNIYRVVIPFWTFDISSWLYNRIFQPVKYRQRNRPRLNDSAIASTIIICFVEFSFYSTYVHTFKSKDELQRLFNKKAPGELKLLVVLFQFRPRYLFTTIKIHLSHDLECSFQALIEK